MRVYNRFIVILGVSFSCVTVVLAAFNISTLDVYVICYTLVLLFQSALYTYLSPRVRGALGLVSLAAAGGFIVLIALKAIEILVVLQ